MQNCERNYSTVMQMITWMVKSRIPLAAPFRLEQFSESSDRDWRQWIDTRRNHQVGAHFLPCHYLVARNAIMQRLPRQRLRKDFANLAKGEISNQTYFALECLNRSCLKWDRKTSTSYTFLMLSDRHMRICQNLSNKLQMQLHSIKNSQLITVGISIICYF